MPNNIKKKQPDAKRVKIDNAILREESTLVKIETNGSKSCPRIGKDGFLKAFLHPFEDEEVFMQSILHKKAFAVTGLGKERVQSLLETYLCGGNVEKLIENTASEDGVSVWLPNNNNNNNNNNDDESSATATMESFKVTDPQLTLGLFRDAGASLYMRAPKHACEDLTQAIFHDLEIPFSKYADGSSRGEVEVFLASQHSKRTPTHTDFQENFTIQLLGRKVWRFHRGDVIHPLRAKSPHFANTPMNVIETQLLASKACGGSSKMDPPSETSPDWVDVELNEGDILYHPPGIWHNVQSVGVGGEDEDPRRRICLSINISIVAPTWADAISHAVRQLLWTNPILRRPISVKDAAAAQNIWQSQFLGNHGMLQTWIGISTLLPPEVCKQDHDEVIEWPSTRTNETNHYDQTQFIKNPLALMIFDTDAGEHEDDEKEATCDMIVHINIGYPEMESLVRFEIVNIPRENKHVLEELRQSSKTVWSRSELKRYWKTKNDHQWKILVDILIRCGWFTLHPRS